MTVAIVSPVAYSCTIAVVAALGAILCVAARRKPGPWTITVARVIGLALAVDAVSWWTLVKLGRGDWSIESGLPLALCNIAVFVTAAACWWRTPLLVELTYFWGMAGATQALLTPDLTVGFPDPEFFQYVGGHVVVVAAAAYLVLGLRIVPRRGAVWRVFLITVGYTAFVGGVDLVTGANYMFLRRAPDEWSVLRLLGPWPWYLVTAAAVALAVLALLDAPFWIARRRDRRSQFGPAAPTGTDRRSRT